MVSSGSKVKLTVYLDEGYKNDTIVAKVDGKKVYERTKLTTKLTISLADQFETEINGKGNKLTINVTTKGIEASKIINSSEDVFFRAWIEAGQLHIEQVPKLAYF